MDETFLGLAGLIIGISIVTALPAFHKLRLSLIFTEPVQSISHNVPVSVVLFVLSSFLAIPWILNGI